MRKRASRPLSLEEREDLCRRAGSEDLLDFLVELKCCCRRLRMGQRQMLAVWLRIPRPTDLPEAEILSCRNELAEAGFELTPAEVVDTVEKALCKVRNAMREHGVPEVEIPTSDLELRAYLYKNISL